MSQVSKATFVTDLCFLAESTAQQELQGVLSAHSRTYAQAKIINEIITECQAILSNDGYITPNRKIIGVILREFEEIRDWYLSTNKILLLSNKNWKLWSIKTIIDSANYDFDAMLFDKVREFQKQCDMLDESIKDYRY